MEIVEALACEAKNLRNLRFRIFEFSSFFLLFLNFSFLFIFSFFLFFCIFSFSYFACFFFSSVFPFSSFFHLLFLFFFLFSVFRTDAKTGKNRRTIQNVGLCQGREGFFTYVSLLALEMWCLDDTGPNSWDWVGPPA